jgi:alkylhydroperoxidase family enzyme
MTDTFKFHDLESAPEASKELLSKLFAETGRNGFYAVLAESPETLKAYTQLHSLFMSTSFTDEERTVIWQTINVEQECTFCVPAHTAMAKHMKIDDKVSNALRDESPLPTAKLEALRSFTLEVVRTRGNASKAVIADFLKSGYTHQNILEVVLGLSQKIISNYTNHLAKTPMEEKYSQFSWTKAQKQ